MIFIDTTTSATRNPGATCKPRDKRTLPGEPRGWRRKAERSIRAIGNAEKQPREYVRTGPRVRFLDPAAHRRINWDYHRALVAAHNAETDPKRRRAIRDCLSLLQIVISQEQRIAVAR